MSMRKKYSGSVVRANPVVPTEDSAPGIWTLEQQNQNQKRGTWPFVGDPNFKDTVLLLHGDTSQQPSNEDQSRFNQDVEIVGDAKATNFSPYSVSDGFHSVEFFNDGTNSEHLVFGPGGATDFNLNKNADWCVEFWLYLHVTPDSYDRVAEQYNSGSYWAIKFNNTGNGKICIGASDTATNGVLESAEALPLNQWVHVAFTNDGTNVVLRLFVNGQLSNSASSWTQAWTDASSAHSLQIGNYRSRNQHYVLNGLISNFRLTQGRTIYSAPFTVPTSPLTVDTGTRILCCNSSSYKDQGPHKHPASASTTNGYPIIRFDSPFSYTPTATVSDYGSYYFDGTGDYLTIVNDVIDVGTNPFAIEIWAYLKGSSSFCPLWGISNGGGSALKINLHDSGNGSLTLENSGGGGNFSTDTGVRSIMNNAWTHIVFVREGTGTNQSYIYVNGIVRGTGTVSANLTGWTGRFRFARNPEDYSTAMAGYISNARIVKMSPSAPDYTVLYTSAFTPPTKPTELTLTEGENSVYFDGTGDYLTTSSSSDFQFGTGAYTVELWIYPTSGSGERGIFSTQASGIYGISMWRNGTTLYLEERATLYAAANPRITGTITLNIWNHIALSRDSTSGTLRGFINGVQFSSTTTNLRDLQGNIATIGDNSVAANPFDGYISNVKLTNLNLYTGTFTPPTSPSSGGLLLACASRYIEDRSPANHDITANGDAVVSGFNPFDNGYWSVHLDSTSDKIQVATASALPSGTAARTVEFWAKVSGAASGTQYFFGYGNNNGGGNFSWARDGNGNFAFFGWGQSPHDWATSVAVPQDEWFHVSLTSSGSQIKFYLNGTLEHTQSYATSTASVSNLYINQEADGSGYGFANLKISNFIMYSSVVRTGNFTAPTVPETDTTNVVLLVAQSSRPIDNSSNSNTVTFTGATIDEDIPFQFLPRQTKLLNLQNNQDVNNRSFQDSSLLRHLITRTNNATQGTFSPFSAEEGKWSVYFDGTNDYLTVPNSTDNNIGGFTEDYTLECWFNLETITSAHRVLFGKSNGGGNTPKWLIGINMNSSATYTANKVGVYSGAGGTGGDGTYSPGFVAGTWYHFRLVYTHSSTTLKIYINGTEVVSNAGNVVNSSGAFTWGADGEGNGDFIGNISNLRLIKGTALDSTVPTKPLTAVANTKLLTAQSNRFVDNSSSSFAITAIGTPKVYPYAPFAPSRSYSKDVVGGSAYLDGSGDYLTTDTGDTFDFYGEFTVECWFYLTDDVNWGILFCANVSDRFQIAVTNSNTIDLRFNGSATGTPFSINKHEWNHVAVTRDSSNVIRQFLNGVLKNTDTNTNSLDNGYMRIGANQDGSNPFEGYIANARIVNGQAIYTTAFDTPTSLVTRTSDTKLLMNFTDGAVIDNSSKANLETGAGAATEEMRVSTSIKKFGNASMYFDGGDVLRYYGGTGLHLGTGPFTAELFVKFDGNPNNGGTNGQASLMRDGGYGTGGGAFVIQRYNGEWEVGTEVTPQIQVAQTLENLTWYHVALTRDSSSNLRLFVDGTQLGSTSANFTTNFTENRFYFGNFGIGGGAGARNLTGYLDDIRLTKGVARYTSNFTAPTRAFKNR